jgi:hypothetical protein
MGAANWEIIRKVK